jgi:predicted aspartyl protease
VNSKSIFHIPIWLLVFAVAAISQISLKPLAEVPFEFHKNLIFVDTFINGKGPFKMMLDTGTDPSALDLATVRELGLATHSSGQKAAGGGTGSTDVHDLDPVTVKLSKLKPAKIEISAIDLSAISQALEKPINGILGHSFLKNRIVEIDYPANIVRFYSRRSKSKDENKYDHVIPFRFTSESILIDAFVNDQKVTALFDTGLNGSFAVMPAALKKLGLIEAFKAAKPANSVGFNGKSSSRKGEVKTVSVAGFSISPADVVFWNEGTGHDTTAYEFTIGNGFLKNYVVTIDYTNDLIRLKGRTL